MFQMTFGKACEWYARKSAKVILRWNMTIDVQIWGNFVNVIKRENVENNNVGL